MDPVTALGAAGSVVGIAGFGIQLSQILYNYLSQIWSAQERLEAIVDEIGLTTSALKAIYGFLEQELANIKRGQPLYLFSGSSLKEVKSTANKCLVVFWRVEATISGNWPAEIEDQLVVKLLDFDNKLKHYTPGSPIQIESELTLDPLGWRDKIRWPAKASKLDKYCKQLQRYQDSLVLLLQVVSLGQQRLKPNPTEEDIRLMQRTYTIIHTRIIALETETQSQNWQSHVGRGPSRVPNHSKRPQTPSRAVAGNRGMSKPPAYSKPRNLNSSRPRNPLMSQPVTMDTPRTGSPQSVVSQPRDNGYINGHTNTPDQKPPAQFQTSIDKATRYEDDLTTSNPDDTGPTAPPPQAEANNAMPDFYVADTKQASPDIGKPFRVEEYNELPKVIKQTAGKASEIFDTGNPDARAIPPSPQPQGSPSNAAQPMAKPQSAQIVAISDVENALLPKDVTKKDTRNTEVQILPYVLHDEGAYQLPVSLGLDLKSNL